MLIPDGLSFAELNDFYAEEKEGDLRSMPFEQFFGEMGISEEQRDRRIDTAKDIKSFILIALTEMYLHRNDGTLPFDELNKLQAGTSVTESAGTVEYVNVQYGSMLERLDVPLTEGFKETHASMFAMLFVAATLDHLNDAYFFSEDRATLIAENEANSIWNDSEYQDAILTGKTRKTWHAIMDKRTRDTHRDVNGTSVLIDEPFFVGDSLLLFPTDESLGASAEEIVNCRCWVTYS